MRYLKIAFAVISISVLAGCASSSSSGVDLTISRGDATGRFAGTYNGTISLTSAADVVGKGVATDDRVEAVSIRVTADGLAFLTVRGVTLSGVVDNNGNWGVQASVDDLRVLVSDKNISLLNDAGCSLGTKAARIQGVIDPPTMRGDISGNLKCKRAEVTVATLTTSGVVAASSAVSANSTTATGDLTGSSNSAPVTPGTKKQIKFQFVQTVQASRDGGWLFDSTELKIEYVGGTLTRRGGRMFVRKHQDIIGNLVWDISELPANAQITRATMYMVFDKDEGIANADYTGEMEVYGWVNGNRDRELIRTVHANDDIKSKGYNKINNRVPFDYTDYVRRVPWW
jgi:hypothetical protein